MPAFTFTARRRTALAVLAAAGVAATTALAPGAAVARPIRLDTGGAKGCKLPGGNPIRSGGTGRAGGIEYACTDGVACQVENGRRTGKCSHAAQARQYSVTPLQVGSGQVLVFARQ